MTTSDIAIQVENLGKMYRIYDRPSDRLKQMLWGNLIKRSYGRNFWALKDISFKVAKGETIGIIGKNGTGKSTLLQLIAGTLSPSAGQIYTNGKVAALLELGSGFNPDFTGRENVLLNAALLGLSIETTNQVFSQIVDFAGIGSFLDQPIRTYSSGMIVRLAFAIIAHVKADILIVDEALAVGDVFFQQKCMRFMREFKAGGGTILLVSHDTSAVLSMCNKALLMPSRGIGSTIFGDSENVCKLYLEDIYKDPSRVLPEKNIVATPGMHDKEKQKITIQANIESNADYVISGFNSAGQSFGQGKANIVEAGIFDIGGQRLIHLQAETRVQLRIKANILEDIVFPAFGFMLKNRFGEYLFTEGTDGLFRDHQLVFHKGQTVSAIFEFDMPTLMLGIYTVNVAIAEGLGDQHRQQHWIHDVFVIESKRSRLVHGHCGTHKLNVTLEIESNHD